MATRRSDIIIPEIFTPYLLEATTQRDAFLQSGVVAPMAELNATEDGGDFVNVPFFNANLLGDMEPLEDDKSLVPGKITANKQRGVVLHRGRAFESRDLAALAAGADPMAAIGDKLAGYINHHKQKDLLACLEGAFGGLLDAKGGEKDAPLIDLAVGVGEDTPTAMTPTSVLKAQSKLGEVGEKLSTIVMHSAIYYSLKERRLIDNVLTGNGTINKDSSTGTMMPAFEGQATIPTFCGLRVIVSDDVTNKDGNYASYLFSPGAVGSGEQMALRTETDRDILAKSNAMSFDAHYVYHPIGLDFTADYEISLGRDGRNPSKTVLAESRNWRLAYELENIGIARITSTSSLT